MKDVETIISPRWIIPAEPSTEVLEHHALVIDAGCIAAIMPVNDVRQHYHARRWIERPAHVLIPGLINAHTHAAMTLLRGIADDLPLMDWLTHHIWPLEQKWVSETFVRDGTDLAIAEMLRGGTTTFNDMYFFPEITAQRALQHGMRAVIGLIVIDFPSAYADSAAAYIDQAVTLYESLRDSPLLHFAFAPHAPYSVSDTPLQRIRALADELDLPIHMHVHETRAEVQQASQQFGQRPLQRLADLGLISPGFIAVHMTQLTDEEIAFYAERGGHIVHCPESNMKLASGACPVARCLKAGINVALGTDGVASNNDLDLFGEMRTAALFGKYLAEDASALSAPTVLRMATLNGARALGIAEVTGSLVPGKSADVVAVDLSAVETQPLYDPLSALVYCASRQHVSDVWIAGKPLLSERRLTTFDETALLQKAALWQERLVGFAKRG